MTDAGVHPALEYVIAAVHDVLVEDDLAGYRPAVEALAGQFDAADIAAAALKVAYEVAPLRPPRVVVAPAQQGTDATPTHQGGHDDHAGHRHHDGAPPPAADVAQLYVNVGRMDRVRPGDLVGAITGEAGLSGADIGAINIFEKFSLVEVPDSAVDDVIDRMKGATIRGRQAEVRRDRGPKR